jgi:hypothetical protein
MRLVVWHRNLNRRLLCVGPLVRTQKEHTKSRVQIRMPAPVDPHTKPIPRGDSTVTNTTSESGESSGAHTDKSPEEPRLFEEAQL